MSVVYLGKKYEEPLPLSYAEKPITDKGIQGARLMLKEANQAGALVGYQFKMDEAIVPEDGDVVAKAKEILKGGDTFIIADLEPADLLAVADLPEAKNSVIVNIRSSGRRAPPGGVPLERVPHHSRLRHARRCARAISDLEEMAALVRDPRHHR